MAKPRASGFTILELVLVLVLAMLVVGGGISALYFNRDEARLDDSLGEIEVLAKRARTLATLQQRPYALEFTPGQVALLPYGEAVLEEDERASLVGDEDDQGDIEFETASQPVVRDTWVAEEDMKIVIRRWATGEWTLIKRRDRHIWRFDPQGICEPCGVRIELDNENWIAAMFHPLTAGITETESYIK